MSSGSHRKIPKASVMKWLEDNKAPSEDEKDYKKAAADAVMYLVPERDYITPSP